MLKMIKEELDKIYDIMDCDESSSILSDLELLKAAARCLISYCRDVSQGADEVHNNICAMLMLVEDTAAKAIHGLIKYEQLIVKALTQQSDLS